MSFLGLFGKKKHKHAEVWNAKTMFGPNLNFTATEAYKLLRTNIVFSFPDEGAGRAIGVTSSVQSEGKSTTVCNTAYALSEAGYRVLLLEADLRRPSVSSKLGTERSPGLTNLLISKGNYKDVLQQSTMAPKMDILTSGDIPPNPSELLASNRMSRLMDQLKQDYDYVIVDLPPVTVVSDALAVSKNLDGAVMVVRSGVSEQPMLKEALRQLEMVNVPVLGFVYRENNASNQKYGYRYGKKYYKYYSGYDRKQKKQPSEVKATNLETENKP